MQPGKENLLLSKAEYFMELAIEQARRAERLGEVPVGAVLVSPSGEVVATGHNSPISMKDPTAHAEILALRLGASKVGNYRLTGTWMFVTLEPCLMCTGALIWARVQGVVFGAWDPKSGALGSVVDVNTLEGLNHRLEVYSGILAQECAELLRDFFRKRR